LEHLLLNIYLGGIVKKSKFIILYFVICVPLILFSATFPVGNVSELQAALFSSSANGEDDIITVSGGIYNVSSTITFWSDEEYSLLIIGEDSPVFNGGDLVRIMELMTESDNGDIFLEGLNIEHGRAEVGGGVYLETQGAEIRLTDCEFNDNTADNVCGGANLYSITGNVRVTNCIFRRNSSPNSTGYPLGTSGGLFVQTEGEGPEIRLTGCTFEDNTAERDGAGAMLYPMGINSSVLAEHNIFNNNTANEFGGGCWIRGPGGNTLVDYNDNTSSGNSAADAGGGGATYIEIESGTINMSNNSFEDNSAEWQGGALWISNIGGTLNIENNTFTGNSSIQTGGAANIYLETGTANIDHNVFNENESSDAGGGICVSTAIGNLNILNNTFYSNTAADAGDVYCYFDHSSASSSFTGNILYGSTFPALSYSGAHSVTATYSDIEGGTGETWFGVGCIDSDPLFNNSADSDFDLTSASPCIDAGNPTSPNDPDGTVNDMGAFYFNQTALSAPANISISYAAGNVIIYWDEVAEATSYTVYADSDPNGSFETSVYNGASSNCTIPSSGNISFYRITASD
jgi:hypothetical protein